MQQSKRFSVYAAGPLACFTRPEMKVERVSYELMTPSAARGLLEAILWKPAIVWNIRSIAVLQPIRWISFRRNEVTKRASERADALFADENRAQRNTVALRDVAYVLEASFSLTKKAGPGDSIKKFSDMFERRISKGQWFQPPYLGCREFAADVRPAPESWSTIDPGVARPLGLMFYDFDFPEPSVKKAPTPLFFDARLENGVLRVPERVDVLTRAESETQ